MKVNRAFDVARNARFRPPELLDRFTPLRSLLASWHTGRGSPGVDRRHRSTPLPCRFCLGSNTESVSVDASSPPCSCVTTRQRVVIIYQTLGGTFPRTSLDRDTLCVFANFLPAADSLERTGRAAHPSARIYAVRIAPAALARCNEGSKTSQRAPRGAESTKASTRGFPTKVRFFGRESGVQASPAGRLGVRRKARVVCVFSCVCVCFLSLSLSLSLSLFFPASRSP